MKIIATAWHVIDGVVDIVMKVVVATYLCVLVGWMSLTAGCGTARLERRLAELEVANRALEAKVGTDPEDAPKRTTLPAVVPPEAHAQRPLVGFVNYKPDFCSGALCLRIQNHRPHPIVNIRINGQRVAFQQAAALYENDVVYVRLMRPGRVVLEAMGVDAVSVPHGKPILTRTPLEGCRSEFLVGTVADARWGPSATISAFNCASVAAWQ
ncbi:hypothetical protein HY480_02790 [Candidatus Uhrbacteria bacterium]|nr:hypothetical protein [Candidatus Uhrbacteria bacterium]